MKDGRLAGVANSSEESFRLPRGVSESCLQFLAIRQLFQTSSSGLVCNKNGHEIDQSLLVLKKGLRHY